MLLTSVDVSTLSNLDPNLGKRRTYSVISVENKGHIKRECLEKKKRDTKNKEGSSKSVNVVEEDSESGDGDMLSVSSSSDHPTYSCILDSACSYRTTLNKDLLDNYMLVNSDSIMIGSDDPYKVIGIENIQIKRYCWNFV